MNRRRLSISVFSILVFGIYGGVAAIVPAAHHSALEQIVTITLLTALLSFIFSILTNDYSWTDRLWSVSPAVYALFYAYHAGFSTPILLPTALILLWGIRLSFNFGRRGGYTGEEDYRWPILRERISSPVLWTLFNLMFIAMYQQLLFILFTLPLHVIDQHSSVHPLTLLAGTGALFFLILETVADQQQYVFQQAKHGYTARRTAYEEEYRLGFRRSGLFALSRHPNYLGELGFWWCIYLIGASLTGALVNYSLIGPVLLTLLFLGSTAFTEGISAGKYEEYETYRQEVWPIFPKLWSRNTFRN